MKKSSVLIALSLLSSIAFASSSVKFPVKHQEVKPYPGSFAFILNSPTGLRNGVYYTLTCQIVNPNQEQVILKMEALPYLVCGTMGGCAAVRLNGEYSDKMLHLNEGTSELKISQVMTADYNVNTKLSFSNYDNDNAVFIESCKADLE